SGLEAPCHRGTVPADAAAFVSRTMRLSCIFEHSQAMLSRNRKDRIDIRWLAVQVYRDDGLGARRNGCINPADVNVVGGLQRFNRNWGCSTLAYGQPGCNEGVSRNDNFIPRANIHGAQR